MQGFPQSGPNCAKVDSKLSHTHSSSRVWKSATAAATAARRGGPRSRGRPGQSAQPEDGLFGAGVLLEGLEDGRVEAPGAQPPGGGLAGQGGLAHAAHPARRPGPARGAACARGRAARARGRGSSRSGAAGNWQESRRGRRSRRSGRRGGRVRAEQDRVRPDLVELGDEPVLQAHSRRVGAERQPALRVGAQGRRAILRGPAPTLLPPASSR